MNPHTDGISLTSSCNRFDTMFDSYLIQYSQHGNAVVEIIEWILKPFSNLSMVYDALIGKKSHNSSQKENAIRNLDKENFQFFDKKVL